MVKLPVPYRSQWDSNDADDHKADCGPTCLAMILNFRGVAMTPNDLYSHIEEPNRYENGVTDYNQLIKAGRDLGIKLNHRQYSQDGQQIALNNLRANLDVGNPGLALVRYLPWRQPLGNLFDGGHFVVVTGYDDGHIFIHDPLFGLWVTPADKGAHFAMPNDLFVAGWGSTFDPDPEKSIGFNFSVAYNGEVVNPGQPVPPVLHPPPPPPPPPPVVTPTPPPPVVTPTPPVVPPTPPPPAGQGQVMDDVNRRIRALAAYRWAAAPDFANPASVQPWLDNLGDFGLQYDAYVIRPGDTLSGLAARFYGQQNRWPALKAYNNLQRDGLFLGETIFIPRLGVSGAHTNPALPHDTADFSKDLEFLLVDPDQAPLDYNEIAGDNSIGIGFVNLPDM